MNACAVHWRRHRHGRHGVPVEWEILFTVSAWRARAIKMPLDFIASCLAAAAPRTIGIESCGIAAAAAV